MIQALPVRGYPIIPFKYVRYYESKHNRIRIFGLCEVTGKHHEVHVPAEGFFVYCQGFKTIDDALAGSTPEDRDFIVMGISPEGRALA